jgi:hypothetical protein
MRHHLILLDVLSACLEDAVHAVRAAHPEIDDVEGVLGEPPDAWLADILVTHLNSLIVLLSRYRAAADLHRRLGDA